MADATSRRLRAPLERLEGNLGWVVARLPFDPKSEWPRMIRLRVVVEMGGQSFRTSLFPDQHRKGYVILVNKKMQRAAGAGLGAIADFSVTPDLEHRTAAPPSEFAAILKSDRTLGKWFLTLSDSTRSEIGRWIQAVKSPQARQRRAEQMAERLMLTMEGEKTLPPILQVAFRRDPKAHKGWEAMTRTQRRGHLMGIFYYQTPEAREKRVEKLLDEARRIAGKD